ncbi:methyl-accepting chemotaxis protein [Vibrio hannami]|uniref:methyl-accepting chemotaxis protein n=1 Tax=Vibrio hannami TaxID=2717094 RepID=UPI00240FFEDA|nr:methyl-accepting chemotaxis protein [Vibrio hannami]MDG3088560.1 methyl-accepting chemotaxis protein [Vibrio hannami]
MKRVQNQMQTALVTEAEMFQQRIDDISHSVTEFAKLVESQKSRNEMASSVAVMANLINADSVVVGFDDNVAFGSHWKNQLAPTSYQVTNRSWYRSAKLTEQVTVSDPFISMANGEMVFSIAKRFSDGVVVATVKMELLKEMVDRAAASAKNGIVVQADGTAIYSNVSAVKPGDKTQQFAPKLYQSILAAHDIDSFEQIYDGQNEIVLTKKLIVRNNTWYLAIAVLERDAYALLGSVRRDAIVSIIVSTIVAVGTMLLLLHFLYRPVIQLRNKLAELASGRGDLTQRLSVVNEHDDLGIITIHINQWIENNQHMMQEIRSVSEALGVVINEVSETALSNQEALSLHVKQTELVVSAIEELSVTSKNVSLNAYNAAELAHSANKTGRESREIVLGAQNYVLSLVKDVQQSAESVSAMNDKTENIGSITEVIGGIAGQTNLLALNAAIEAARAGEQGRGFAVVADEVRHLASRTQSSTVEIDEAVKNLLASSDSIVSNMELTRQAGESAVSETEVVTLSLTSLTDHINEMNSLSSEIATAASEQTRVTGEVAKNIFKISEMANVVRDNVEHSAKNVDTIASMYSQLSSMVAEFQID